MADKTIRPSDFLGGSGDNGDKTIRPTNSGTVNGDATIRPTSIGNGDTEKTIRPQGVGSGDVSKTIRPQMPGGGVGDKTVRTAQQAIDQLNRTYEKEYVIDGKKYKFVKVLSEGTGEGNLLLVEHGGKQFVLKLYYPGLSLADTEILKAVKSTDGKAGLVGLYSFGNWTNPNTNETVAYELMQYCEGGSLASYDIQGDELQLKKLAVMMALCIHTCHEKGFLHCDVKPANFLFVDKGKTRLVLTDFGISSRFDKDGLVRIQPGDKAKEARTPTYAAPEFYYSVPGQARELTKSSDFYSLGIALLCLWMGESAFRQKEAELMRWKQMGKLPYPDNLKGHTLSLIKTLTAVDYAIRPTFQQIKEWASGGDPFASFVPAKEEKKSTFHVIYNAGKNQIANSPEELAELMYKDQALAQKYLYSGKINQWLKENLRPELEVEIEEIVENKYATDKQAGVYAACYVLDPAMPYYDVKGNPCTTQQEIASAILHNRAAYVKNLKNGSDLLYVLLRMQGLDQYADNLYKKMSVPNAKPEDLRDAVVELVYTLDPNQPFVYETRTGKQIDCNTLKDVIDAARENGATDDTWRDIRRPAFIKWIEYRDKNVAARIRTVFDGWKMTAGASSWGVLFCCSRSVNFQLGWDQNTMYTYQHIGEALNKAIDATFNPNEYSAAEQSRLNDIYNYVRSIKGTVLYFYLKSKGTYDSWIDFIEYCFDINSKDNRKKPAPYNEKVATYKCIQGMGVEPFYRTASGKILTKPQDAKKLSRSELKTELSDKRGLKEWLTVFYQEDNKLDLTRQFAFEKKTDQYMQFLASLDDDLPEVGRYQYATAQVQGAINGAKRQYGAMVAVRILLALLCFVPLATLVVVLCVLGFPFEGNIMKGHFWGFTEVTTFILFIPMCIMTGLDGKLIGEVICSWIVAAILYWLLYLLMAFLVPVAPYAIALILVVVGWLILKKCYIDLPLNQSDMNAFTDGSRLDDILAQPLHYTFHPTSGTFDSPIIDEAKAYENTLSANLKKLLWWAIPTMVITAGLFALMVALTPRLMAQQSITSSHIPHMVGTWKGYFNGKTSLLDITSASADNVEGVIHVRFKQVANEKVAGSINTEKKTMFLRDQVKNNVLDGTYNCTFTDETYSAMKGTYYNSKSGAKVEFEYSREITEAEKQAAAEFEGKSTWELWIEIFKKKFNIHS